MSNSFVGLLLNSFSDIMFKPQKYYITSLLGQNIFASQMNMFYICFHLQMRTPANNLLV